MSCLKVATVSDKGQISIHLDIRELMGIEKGDSLVLVANENELIVRKSDDIAKKVLKDEDKIYLLASQESMKKLWDNDEDARWEKY